VLVEAGVPAAAIEVIPDEPAAVDAALRLAEPGDLVLIFGEQISRTWKQIIRFVPGASRVATAAAPPPAPVRIDLPPAAAGFPGEADEVIRDERGVRLAREQDD
jgi:cyanophycin synthetase